MELITQYLQMFMELDYSFFEIAAWLAGPILGKIWLG